MLRPLLILFLGLVLVTGLSAQPCVPANVKINFYPSKICPGDQLTIVITKSNVYFGTGNNFNVEMSDALGAFGTPSFLGTINDTIPDTIFYEIPSIQPAGVNYKIRVTTTSPAHNCYISDSSLTVYPKPTANFTFPNDSQCYNYHQYNFTSTSTISSGSIDSLIWDWADGSNNDTSTTLTASHKYKFFNSFFLSELTAISDKGCRDIAKKQVNIKEMPMIDAEVNDDIQCQRGNFFKMKSLSTTYTGTIVSKNWLFGDGSAMVSNADSVTHQYTNNGIYYFTQINRHSNGCIDSLRTFLLVNPHPVATILTNDTSQCLLGNQFVFEASSTVSNGLPMYHYWNLESGADYPQQDSVHYSYGTDGIRMVRLIAETDDGTDACADTVFQQVLVNPLPKVTVTNYDNVKCFTNNIFRFKAKSTIASGTVTHNWTFGDASFQLNADSVSHVYLADGSYQVEVKAISNFGCRDSFKTNVVVNPSPVPSFTINSDTQCLKINLFKLRSTSSITGGTYTRLWKLSDGSTFSGVDSISAKMSGSGTFYAKLYLISNLNCSDSIADTIQVLPMPLPSYSINNDQQCFRNNSFDFTDNSTFPGGTILGNKWDFDDGTLVNNQTLVNQIYLIDGEYNVRLVIYGDNGCTDTAAKPVFVYPHPGADFSVNDTGQCVNNNTFIFKSNTFISSGNFTNKWLFGDGTFSNQFDLVPKKYKKDSTYVVTNVAFSDHSCPDTISKTITVYPKPATSFTIDNDKQCKLGNDFNFTSATTIKYGTFTQAWNFGDGAVDGNVATTQHSYINAQLFKVRLIATSDNGCLDTTIKDARVYPMPVAGYTLSTTKTCLKGNVFQMNATSTVSNGSGMKHNWYFGDNDSTINASLVSHSYLTEGNYDITLITTTTTGNCKDSITKGVQVSAMPQASFTIDNNTQCLLNNVFNFNSTSGISIGTITSYSWSFGDVTTGSGASVAHSYLLADSFSVILNLVSDNLCTGADTAKVYVNQMPTADFTINPKESCLKNNSFAVTNKSKITKGFITQYEWDYGDGNTSLQQNPPAYSYAASGNYTLGLKTTTDKGCWDTANVLIAVNPNPNLDFDVTEVCFLDSTVFTNNSTISTGTISSYKWFFGDGKTSVIESPKHKYKAVGNYDIKLTAVTSSGCKDTLIKLAEAIVNPLPVARFTYKKLRSWENEVDIEYIDSSIGATRWFWDFSSMGTSFDQNPKVYYFDTLTQNTTLIVYNDFDCSDTINEVLFINPDVIYYMPNSFSPGNDDQINDYFKPVGLAYAKSYKFIIFNRWGQIMFKTDNPQLGWDGKYNNELVQQDNYFYRLEFVGADDLRHEEEGYVVIIR